jgi:hypothetical protein
MQTSSHAIPPVDQRLLLAPFGTDEIPRNPPIQLRRRILMLREKKPG